MQTCSRIPKLTGVTFDAALHWFAQLQCKGLLFHPEDDPESIQSISDGSKMFSDAEIKELRLILDQLESRIGHESVIEAAYPAFVRVLGLKMDA
ncbi:hypothetical protein VVD49_03030 [Uliginosibacterium sp. H3]|uniref:Uncharacterized protein n=1 Tax=Uliginosibacterium silvisoli TaxID=3114758 RepID=A0ABU6JYD7_9RHOO|nr:hypothetical protein [Uliginosibacterium sp. H3]